MPSRDELIEWLDGQHGYSEQIVDAILARWPHIAGPEHVEHHIVETWQERPREFSYRCSCGLVYKHQQFGPIPGCLDGRPDATNPEEGTR